MNEFRFIERLRRRLPEDPRVHVGPGDDCAVLEPVGMVPLLATKDLLLDGVHFTLQEVEPRRIGRKLMAVNLSDIAAMAGRPLGALLGLALPRQGTDRLAEEILQGVREVADEFATPLLGGDTTVWSGPLALSLTLLGTAGSNGPVLRSGARVGDWILTTGPLGGSLLGKHLDFTPRVREAQLLAENADLHAMIDVSDGLAADLNHILEESGCGALLLAERIPIAPAAYRLPPGKSPLEHALGDGEDFELVFTVSPADGARLLETQPIPETTLHHIGTCTERAGLFLEELGVVRPLEPTGFVHSAP